MNREYYAYQRKSKHAISQWISRGVKEPKWKLKKIYDYKLTLHNCEKCHCFFKDSYDKHLHHNHDNGKYVGIYCHDCNSRERLKKTKSSTGFNNITFIKNGKGALYYKIHILRNKKPYQKMFSMNKYNLDQVVEYRDILYQILYII